MDLTQTQAAKALGLSENTVANYDGGKRCDRVSVAIPRVVLLACRAVEEKLPPITSLE